MKFVVFVALLVSFYNIVFLLDLYRLLSKRDIEVVVENGQPFLFKKGEDSVRRMRSFLGNRQTNVSVR